jgi:hypothetical protein
VTPACLLRQNLMLLVVGPLRSWMESISILESNSNPPWVPFDQLWSSKGDITYHPVVNKIINAFTTESSRVMNACTSLLHCFIEHVYRKTSPGVEGRQFHNFRCFNNLSIFTTGSTDTTSARAT